MANETNEVSDMQLVKELATKFTSDELDEYANKHIANKGNGGEMVTLTTEDAISVLSKASYVRSLVDGGLTLPEAVRKLGANMRQMSGAQ